MAGWRLVMLGRAPRNQDARQRMTISPKSDTFGDRMLIVLNCVGPHMWAFDVLRQKKQTTVPM